MLERDLAMAGILRPPASAVTALLDDVAPHLIAAQQSPASQPSLPARWPIGTWRVALVHREPIEQMVR